MPFPACLITKCHHPSLLPRQQPIPTHYLLPSWPYLSNLPYPLCDSPSFYTPSSSLVNLTAVSVLAFPPSPWTVIPAFPLWTLGGSCYSVPTVPAFLLWAFLRHYLWSHLGEGAGFLLRCLQGEPSHSDNMPTYRWNSSALELPALYYYHVTGLLPAFCPHHNRFLY